MKRLTLLLTILLCMAILLSACHASQSHLNNPGVTEDTLDNDVTDPSTEETDPTEDPEQPTEPTTESPTEPPEEEPTEPQPTDPETGLPVYVPGTIELADFSDMFPFDRQYRYCFYSCKGPWQALLTEEQRADFYVWKAEVAKENNYGEFRDEMFLVSIIKRYNIPREDFDRALENYLSMCTPHELKTEFWEAPNGDIIYTFDNEIINEYYRYE